MGCFEKRHSPLPATPLQACVEGGTLTHGTVTCIIKHCSARVVHTTYGAGTYTITSLPTCRSSDGEGEMSRSVLQNSGSLL